MIWYEEFRPRTIEQMILPQRLRNLFGNEINQHFLFAGLHGTGKTTAAKALSKDHAVKQINGSSQRGIDIVRTEIENWCSTQSIEFRGKPKVMFIDEADHFEPGAQLALRGAIEKFHQNAFFILTANYPDKLIPELRKSRLFEIDFAFVDDERKEVMRGYAQRIFQIVKAKGRKITKAAVSWLIVNKFPDLRAIINALQAASGSTNTDKVLDVEDFKTSDVIQDKALYDFILTAPDSIKIYQFVAAKYEGKEHAAIAALTKPFINYMLSSSPKHAKAIGQIAMTTHYYGTTISSSPNKLTSLLACCDQISKLFK